VPLSATTVLVTGGDPPGPTGGGGFDPFSRSTAEVYDRATGTWTAVAAMPSGRGRHRSVPLGTGRVLVTGGTDGGRDEAGFAGTFVYEADGDRWTRVGGLVTGRWAFAATALADGRVLVTGGITRSGLAAANPDQVELTRTTEIFELAPDGTP
jgi:N-acetylneuraminic acid mutarotase